MNEFEDVVFDEVAARLEREGGQPSERKIKDVTDASSIRTIKALREHLCTIALPPRHKGLPRVSRCRTCESQCGYGRRLIELMEEKKQDAKDTAAMPVPAPKQEADGKIAVRLTKSQCVNVAEFIEIHLLDAIRNDTDIDNIGWIEDMIGTMRVLEEGAETDAAGV